MFFKANSKINIIHTYLPLLRVAHIHASHTTQIITKTVPSHCQELTYWWLSRVTQMWHY